jgi:hypothetical protein
MPTGLVTVDVRDFGADNNACMIETCQEKKCQGEDDDDQGASLKLTLRLLGTDPGTNGKTCGFSPNVENCLIKGVAQCRTGLKEGVTTPGPLTVTSPGFAQTDKQTNFVGSRFQVNMDQQKALCGKADDFQAFIALEGLFEACVRDGKHTTCNRQFCKMDLSVIQGSKDDGPLVYKCEQQF